MQQSNKVFPKPSWDARDVLYALFQHKGMVLGFSFAGFLAAALVYFQQEPHYVSEARLLVRYVLQRESGVEPYETRQNPGEKPGDSVINTEIEILTSVDLATEVAEAVGTKRLLPGIEGQVSASDAAGAVLGNLEVGTGQSPNVLHLLYGSNDKDLARTVLERLVECYFQKHLEIHRSASTFDEIARQAAAAKKKHEATEAELNKLRAESGIMSLADATGALTSQRIKTQEELLGVRAALAEKQATIEEWNQHEAADGLTADPSPGGDPMMSEPPPQVITEYRAVTEIIGFLQKRDLELRVKFKPGNRLIALNREQLNTNENRRRSLEQQYPWLVAKVVSDATGNKGPREKWIAEKAGLAAIQAKIGVLEAHLKEIGAQFSHEYALGARIEAVQRQRDIEDAEYRMLETNLKNARIDLTLDPSRMPNITIVQQPSEPVKTFDPLTRKIILGLAGSGVVLGLGIAFLMEWLGGRIRRPIEIQTRLQLPLMLSIPYLCGRRGHIMSGSGRDVPRIGDNDMFALTVGSGETDDPDSAGHSFNPYAEALRDRILFNFEINNVTHKPKFLAVTGLSTGAGTSTIATGLAKSLSEIQGAKVLLVDLSSPHPARKRLHGGAHFLSIAGALEVNGRHDSGETPENLYFASALACRDNEGAASFTALQLYELMPRLQASDYDFIVFDMPAIHETSRTLAMAGMMDKVLLVLDAGNTNRDSLTWGYSELVKGKADVSCIFNKTRTSSPTWLAGNN